MFNNVYKVKKENNGNEISKSWCYSYLVLNRKVEKND